MSYITGAIGFLLAVGLLITFHELGHYWVARLVDVKVLRFSFGFGKPLLRWVRGADKTEYVISAIPLGGYVKMMGHLPFEVEEHDRKRAFCNQPLWARTAIVAAGPAANFLLAILLFALVYMIGFYETKPVMDTPPQHSIAARAGLQGGDEIVQVGSQPVSGWKTTGIAVVRKMFEEKGKSAEDGDFGVIEIEVLRAGERLRFRLDMIEGWEPNNETSVLEDLGILHRRYQPPAVVGKVLSSGSARNSGLLERDKVVSFDGQETPTWRSFVELVKINPGRTVPLVIDRNGAMVELPLHIDAATEEGRRVGRIGAGVHVPEKAHRDNTNFVRYPPWRALKAGAAETAEMSWLTLVFLGRIITGDFSVKNIAGPLTIAEVTGESFNIGLTIYLSMLALLSISIGILNILPIPMLDGGHLLYYLIEFIKRSPVSQRAQLIGQGIGLLAIGMLLFIALYNDLSRLL